MRDLCRDLVIIETRVAPYPSERREHRGRQYLGMPFPEPPPDTPPLSSDALWSSIGNPMSFQLTRASLCDALADAGYSSVLQCLQPPLVEERPNRATFAAFTRARVPIMSVPELNDQAWDRLRQPSVPLHIALRRHPAYRWISALVPQRAKDLAARIGSRLKSTM
jgi:hypothetical protein